MDQSKQNTNRLIHETSPYLKQHAHNPVDWYPWGSEALERARQQDRPIFLSIGYSACHWCHVMEHESFEDPEAARILNDHFVSIKVDREERPDLDQIYMMAVQMMTGQGGWPMSMFLTPDLQPFYGGTYFPPTDNYGRPSFKRVLQALVDAWQTRREEITGSAAQLTDRVRQAGRLPAAEGELEPGLLRRALSQLQAAYDPTYGGFGSAPKFPHPMDLRLLLRIWKRFGDDEALRMARHTLDHMARGGIYDHLGGGFHRYSTDERWLVPHFEKMLYDNALMTSTYLEAFQATGDPNYGRVVEETLGYVLREITSPEGPFFSTQDADSEGEEGKFFVWSAREVEEILGPERAEIFSYVYDVSPQGNWEGSNILHRTKTDAQDSRMLRIPEAEMLRSLAESRRLLFEARRRRVWPGRDDKMLTAWNGLMIDTFAQAAQVMEEPRYADAAARAADFLLSKMRTPQGRLLRAYSSGSEPKLNGYLDDYAFLASALVSLYEATFEVRWIESALELVSVMIEQFWDEAEGGFFYTGRDHETLIARTQDVQDSSTPSGNSMAALALLRLARLTGRAELLGKAQAALRRFRGVMASSPLAVGQMLGALDFCLGPVDEFAIVGEPDAEETRRVVRAIRGRYRPNKVVALKKPGGNGRADAIVPLLADKPAGQTVATYICRDFACQAPVAGAAALEALLEK